MCMYGYQEVNRDYTAKDALNCESPPVVTGLVTWLFKWWPLKHLIVGGCASKYP
jgi:hypothetical protein